MFKKIRNLMGIDNLENNNENNIQNIEEETFVQGTKQVSTETKIEPVKEEVHLVCDCCKESEIIATKEEMLIENPDGTKVSLLKEPTISMVGGSEIDGVFICDLCQEQCLTEEQRRLTWTSGKTNVIQGEIDELNNRILSIQNTIDLKRAEFESEIMSLNNEIGGLTSEINQLNNLGEMYVMEQQELAKSLGLIN